MNFKRLCNWTTFQVASVGSMVNLMPVDHVAFVSLLT